MAFPCILGFKNALYFSPYFKLIFPYISFLLSNKSDTNQLWSPDLNAYRKEHSTIHALMDIWETCIYNINYKQQNVTMFLHLSAAFDCVKQSTLVNKMKIYGLDTSMTNLISSYISYRR